jgi:hypothetical protein
LAAKLEFVYVAADKCIAKLRAIDSTDFESGEEEGADLGLWEQVAPAVGQVFSSINELLGTIREQFPPVGASGLADALDDSLAEMGIGDRVDHNIQAADSVRKAADLIQTQIGSWGQGLRSPDIVASRWRLLEHLQGGQGRFLQSIGDLVYQSALCLADVKRAEVVPYHGEILKESLALRRALVDLHRVALLYEDKLRQALAREMKPLLDQLERDLLSFSKTAPYRSLWARDKRNLVERRQHLRKMASDPDVIADAVRKEVARFAAYVGTLSSVNGRVMLIEHDREVSARCAVKLEQAQNVRAQSAESAAQLLGEVLGLSWMLYGRDAELDAYLRRVKKRGAVAFTPEELATEIDLVNGLIARVPMALVEGSAGA